MVLSSDGGDLVVTLHAKTKSCWFTPDGREDKDADQAWRVCRRHNWRGVVRIEHNPSTHEDTALRPKKSTG